MKEEVRTGWFHCGRCGALFSAELGSGTPENCSECGKDPVVSHSELVFAQAAGNAVPVDEDDELLESESEGPSSRSRSRHRKRKSGLLVFVLAWCAGLVVLTGVVLWLRAGDSDAQYEQLGFDVGTADERLLVEEWQEINRTIAAFFAEAVPETRVEYVLKPGETLRRIAGFQQGNPLVIADEAPENSIFEAIDTPIGKAIESVWDVEGTRKFEAVFFKNEQEVWKIDWANMMRYSERSWPLFLAGDGGNEGEFRLLARRRSDDESGEGRISSVVLIGPQVGYPGEIGASSPEIEVDPDSRIGRVLAAAFAIRDAGEGIYGSKAVRYDPNGMIRLRVRVTREGLAERKFVIREIIACHWYDFDDLGLGN